MWDGKEEVNARGISKIRFAYFRGKVEGKGEDKV